MFVRVSGQLQPAADMRMEDSVFGTNTELPQQRPGDAMVMSARLS